MTGKKEILVAVGFSMIFNAYLTAASAQDMQAQPGAEPSAAVNSGPMEAERRELLSRIHQAQVNGVGTGNYMNAFKHIEGMVGSGASHEDIKPRMQQLMQALKDQQARGQMLKTQRPMSPMQPLGDGAAPPMDAAGAMPGAMPGGAPGGLVPLTGAAPPGASAGGLAGLAGAGGLGGLAGALGGGGGKSDATLDKLRERFGVGEITPEMKQKFLNSDRGKELLKQFLGK